MLKTQLTKEVEVYVADVNKSWVAIKIDGQPIINLTKGDTLKITVDLTVDHD